MSARSVVAAALALAAVGCASGATAPAQWLPAPERPQSEAWGGWIEVEPGPGAEAVRGELIALSADSGYVLADRGFTAFALGRARGAALWSYEGNGETIAIGALLGALSTLSHGVYLIFTAPMWMIGGTAASIYRTHEPRVVVPDHPWADLRAFARFPAGLPPGLDRSSLRAKR